jgi:hypothetical protein
MASVDSHAFGHGHEVSYIGGGAGIKITKSGKILLD